MRYVLDSKQMKEIDSISISRIGIPSMVLMERAALAVTDFIEAGFSKDISILSVCGGGNNGADGIAAARILFEKGFDVTVMLKGNGTPECEQQADIARKSGLNIKEYADPKKYDLIIDALFGIGLSRDIEGEFAGVIEEINESGAVVIAVDIPSGVNATTGQIMGTAVEADYTVTFGYEKTGLLLYPGAECAGIIKVADIGFPKAAEEKISKKAFTYTQEDLVKLPVRNKNTNKGSFGKVLIVAGSEQMGGAACLTGLASYRTGAGLVKVMTHENNRTAVLETVPEALISVYQSDMEVSDINALVLRELEWAGIIVIGPGLSKAGFSEILTLQIISEAEVPVIVDADAINIIAERIDSDEMKKIFENGTSPLIFTPHIKEMERISGIPTSQIKSDPIGSAQKFLKDLEHRCKQGRRIICVLKDARTVVVSSDGDVYFNRTGNPGMAKGGSGDVLCGVIAGLLANGMESFEASCMGVFIHGLAGDMSSARLGEYGMKATDITESICEIMKNKTITR